MAISMGGDGAETPMSDINTTPLVDVMLVLLIIFLIAIPVVIQTVDITLPVQKFEPTKPKNENILLTVTTTDAQGRDPGADGYEGVNRNGECRVYRNVTPIDSTQLVDDSRKYLEKRIEDLGGQAAIESGALAMEDLPEVHIRGDINTPYRCIGGVIHSMQVAGYNRLAFVSSPIDLDATIE